MNEMILRSIRASWHREERPWEKQKQHWNQQLTMHEAWVRPLLSLHYLTQIMCKYQWPPNTHYYLKHSLYSLFIVFIFAVFAGRKDHFPKCKHSFQQWPTLWDQSALQSIWGQPQSAIRHFLSKASLSKIKTWTDTFDRNHDANINCEDTFRLLPKVKIAEGVWLYPHVSATPWPGRLEVSILWEVWLMKTRVQYNAKTLMELLNFGVSDCPRLSKRVLL